jgi:hypothetical protein
MNFQYQFTPLVNAQLVADWSVVLVIIVIKEAVMTLLKILSHTGSSKLSFLMVANQIIQCYHVAKATDRHFSPRHAI